MSVDKNKWYSLIIYLLETHKYEKKKEEKRIFGIINKKKFFFDKH